MEKHRPFQRSPLDNLYLTGDYTKTHVSSGGMEAAIWNANKTAELVAADKMNKALSLNIEYKPCRRMVSAMRIMEPCSWQASVPGAMAAQKKLARKKEA
jgi:hypothetical protein